MTIDAWRTALPYAGTGHDHDAAYLHAHPYSATGHDHAGTYEPTHGHPYAPTSHAHLDADGPTTCLEGSYLEYAVT